MSELEVQVPDMSAQIEEKVNADGVPFAITGVDFTKLPAELIQVIDLIVKADRRKIYTDQAQIDANQAKLNTQKDADYATYKEQAEQRITTLTADYKSLEEELLQTSAELRQETADKLQAISERDEARTNRDNAAAQLDEASREIARLNSQIDDYQKAKVFGEREAQNIIEVEASEASEINSALDKLYTSIENWGSINKVVKPDGTFELVKNGDLEQWAPAQGGSETSQGTFPEAPEADTQDSELPAASGEVTPPPFPDEAEVPDMDNAVGGEPSDAEVAPITRGEFEALAARVAQLENGQVGVAA